MEFIGPANVDNNVSGHIQCSIIEPNAQYCIQLVKSQHRHYEAHSFNRLQCIMFTKIIAVSVNHLMYAQGFIRDFFCRVGEKA